MTCNIKKPKSLWMQTSSFDVYQRKNVSLLFVATCYIKMYNKYFMHMWFNTTDLALRTNEFVRD